MSTLTLTVNAATAAVIVNFTRISEKNISAAIPKASYSGNDRIIPYFIVNWSPTSIVDFPTNYVVVEWKSGYCILQNGSLYFGQFERYALSSDTDGYSFWIFSYGSLRYYATESGYIYPNSENPERSLDMTFTLVHDQAAYPSSADSFNVVLCTDLRQFINMSAPSTAYALIGEAVIFVGNSTSAVGTAVLWDGYLYVNCEWQNSTASAGYIMVTASFNLPDSFAFAPTSVTNYDPPSSAYQYAYFYPLVNSNTIENTLTSAGGANSALNQSNSQVSSSLQDYKNQTNTQEQYNKIKPEIFDFDSNIFLNVASTSTAFAAVVSGLFSAFGNFSSALTLFLILALISAIIGIARVLGGVD